MVTFWFSQLIIAVLGSVQLLLKAHILSSNGREGVKVQFCPVSISEFSEVYQKIIAWNTTTEITFEKTLRWQSSNRLHFTSIHNYFCNAKSTKVHFKVIIVYNSRGEPFLWISEIWDGIGQVGSTKNYGLSHKVCYFWIHFFNVFMGIFL